jgi:hypothetical protein
VSKLAGAGVLMPDPNLEDYLRELSGLPPAEHDGANFGMPPMPEGNLQETPEEETSTLDELESPEGAEPLDGDTD